MPSGAFRALNDVGGRRVLLVLMLGVVLVELLRTAWISDDAAITLRTVLNFLHGYGPVFNIDERVQAYTHPLWFLLLTAGTWLSGDVYFATRSLGILVSLVAVWLLVARVAKDEMAGLVGALALVLSKAWVDFATSGLENPLSHMLLLFVFLAGVAAAASGRRRELTLFFLACSLLYLSRPDLLLLVLPLTLWVTFRAGAAPPTLVGAVVVGALPAFLWTGFSLFYYGFPFPNTAYAKLGAGIDTSGLLLQGGRYFLDSLQRDPLTLGVTGAGIAAGLLLSGATRALAAGIVLYLLWVAGIGGDFMSGRFFTAPLVAAVVILVRVPLGSSRLPLAVAAVSVLALGATALPSTLLSGRDYESRVFRAGGIADERGYYFQDYGLFNRAGSIMIAPSWAAGPKDFAVVCGGLGFYAISRGPGMHVIDSCGLADPLLSRLPAQSTPNWRIGHFRRQLPTDYVQSVYRGSNLLTDPATYAYYEIIRHVTRGPLLDAGRLRDLLRLNLGLVPRPDMRLYRDEFVPRTSRMPEVTLVAVQEGKHAIGFVETLDIVLPEKVSLRSMALLLSNNDHYLVSCEVEGRFVPVGTVKPDIRGPEMVRAGIALHEPTPPTDRIRIAGRFGDGRFALGDLRLNAVP